MTSPTRRPKLTPNMRRAIDEMMLDVKSVWGAKKGDPGREDIERFYAAGLEALVALKNIELRYSRRMITAVTAQDPQMMLAAIYGLEKDKGSLVKSSFDTDFHASPVMRAARILTKGEISRWIAQASGMFQEVDRKRGIMELCIEKLAELDALVAINYPDDSQDKSDKTKVEPADPDDTNEPTSPSP